MPFGTVIAGYDGKAPARDALAFASTVAEACGARLVVAYVFEEEHPWSEYDQEYHFDLRHDMYDLRRAAAPALEAVGRDHAEFAGVPARNAHQGLTALAESERADLLVVGSTHRGPVGRILVGSTGGRLLGGAPCSLAVAPHGYAHATPERHGVIGVGVDGSRASELGLSLASGLALGLGGRVVAIGVNSSPDAAHARIDEALTRIEAPQAERIVLSGDPAEQLAASACDLDALVVGSRAGTPAGRILAGSVSRRLMRSAPTPVVIAPEKVAARTAAS